MTASGIVPGHHLLLHLTNPRIRHPNEARGLVFSEIRKQLAGVPQARISANGGAGNTLIGYCFSAWRNAREKFRKGRAGPSSTGTGTREKTNPCGAVKPEIAGSAQSAANRFFNSLPLA
jgi:hypothetical protein